LKEISIEEAERLAGQRLDRRRKYATTKDGMPDDTTGYLVFSLGLWTRTCSGCYESEGGHPAVSYNYDEKAKCAVGAGCEECGHTGKRREEMWLPHFLPRVGVTLPNQETSPLC
jgi:hypothetical protein